MPYSYKNLPKKSGSPGLGATVYLAPISSFDTIAGVPTGGVTQGDSVIIVDDHEFLTGKGFIKAYSTQEFTDMTGETSGEVDSKTMNWTVKAWLPGASPEASEFVKNGLNEEGFIVLVKDADCASGQQYQVGTHCTPAKLEAKFESGTLGNGKKGFEIMLKASLPYLLFYSGDIVLQP